MKCSYGFMLLNNDGWKNTKNGLEFMAGFFKHIMVPVDGAYADSQLIVVVFVPSCHHHVGRM
ncbi:MAG: hypothetical protein SH856_13535 [Flavobacteriales bacterium]|nr:hypothetical protein [Flavobacteriales bacterium]